MKEQEVARYHQEAKVITRLVLEKRMVAEQSLINGIGKATNFKKSNRLDILNEE